MTKIKNGVVCSSRSFIIDLGKLGLTVFCFCLFFLFVFLLRSRVQPYPSNVMLVTRPYTPLLNFDWETRMQTLKFAIACGLFHSDF